jgi:hypothetical protein
MLRFGHMWHGGYMAGVSHCYSGGTCGSLVATLLHACHIPAPARRARGDSSTYGSCRRISGPFRIYIRLFFPLGPSRIYITSITRGGTGLSGAPRRAPRPRARPTRPRPSVATRPARTTPPDPPRPGPPAAPSIPTDESTVGPGSICVPPSRRVPPLPTGSSTFIFVCSDRERRDAAGRRDVSR